MGQGFEVHTDIPEGKIDAAALTGVEEAFHRTYERIYGHADRGQAVEGTNWRLAAIKPTHLQARYHVRHKGSVGNAVGSRLAYFPEMRGFVPCPVYARYDLPPSFETRGPAIVEEDDCTTVVPPRWMVSVDAQENLVLSLVR